MLFQIRHDDGGIESVSGGTLIEADGSARRLSADDMQITVGDQWRSPETQGEYPARWRVLIPSAQIDLKVEPWIEDQEMRVNFAYWEGAVRLSGASGGASVTGNGYSPFKCLQGCFPPSLEMFRFKVRGAGGRVSIHFKQA